MADYSFFFNPMSRSQVARWALHEAGADYDPIFVQWDARPDALMRANPMGKLPTLIHHHGGHDHVVTEGAAICHYLAEREQPDLLPRDEEKADYYRWLFFAAGPIDQAITAQALGWKPTEEQQGMAGFGSLDRTANALDTWLGGRTYVCGDRFTMADVYVGSMIDWGVGFNLLPQRDSFAAYVDRLRPRAAYRQAKEIDMRLIEEAKGGG